MDLTSSPRYSGDQYDTAINIVSNDILDDRYNNIKKKRPYSFESVQKVRDELWTLIIPVTFAMTSDLLSAADIVALGNHKYTIAFNLTVNGVVYNCQPTSYAELPILRKDPYKRPQITEPDRLYYIESVNGTTFIHDSNYVPTSLVMDYMKVPTAVFHGQEWEAAQLHNFTIGNILIAMEITIYNGVTYSPGQSMTIVTGVLQITSGKVVINYVSSDYPLGIHEEICRRAASLLAGNVQDYNRKAITEKDSNNQ